MEFLEQLLLDESTVKNNYEDSNNNDLATQKIAQLLYYKRKIHANSTSWKILQMLYPDIKLTLKQIISNIDQKSYPYTKKITLNLCRDEYLQHDNSTNYNRKYSLTNQGRWFAVAAKLEISFQSLCLLAAVYNKVKIHPYGAEQGYYLTSYFRRIFDATFDENVSAIYSKQGIFKSIKNLLDRNLVYQAFQDVLKIHPYIFEILQSKYDVELVQISRWICSISEKCKEEYLKNLKFTEKQKRLFLLMSTIEKQTACSN